MRRIWVPQLITGAMLVWALNPNNPYVYYVVLRWVCCGVFAYLALTASRQAKRTWMWTLAITSVVYNPIAPLRLTREIWSVLNVLTLAIGIASIFAVNASQSRENSITDRS